MAWPPRHDHTAYRRPAYHQPRRIHDHISWCTFGVIQGVEREELFGGHLTHWAPTTTTPATSADSLLRWHPPRPQRRRQHGDIATRRPVSGPIERPPLPRRDPPVRRLV